MYFYKLDEREQRELVPGIRAKTFWADKMLTSVVDLDPGAILPEHSHSHEQHGLVITGEFTLTIDGETRTLLPGDVYIIPGDIVHSGVNGPVLTRVIDVFAPVREGYKY